MMIKHDETAVAGLTGVIWTLFNHSLTAAALGRLVWHLRQVNKGERRFFEPSALGMEFSGVLFGYIAGLGLAAIIGLDGDGARGLVLIVSYFSPDGCQAILNRYLQGRKG